MPSKKKTEESKKPINKKRETSPKKSHTTTTTPKQPTNTNNNNNTSKTTKTSIDEDKSSIIKDKNTLMKEMTLFKTDNNRLKRNVNIHKTISNKSKTKILTAVKRTKYIPSILDILIECKNVYDSTVKILKEENLQLIKLQQVKSMSSTKRNTTKKKNKTQSSTSTDNKTSSSTTSSSIDTEKNETNVDKELDDMENEILNMMSVDDSNPIVSNENTNDALYNDIVDDDDDDDEIEEDVVVDDEDDTSSNTENKDANQQKNTVLVNKKNINKIKENNVNILISTLGDVVENLCDVAIQQAKLYDELVESDKHNKMIIEQQDQRLDNIENSLLSQFKSMYDDAKRHDAAYIYSKRAMMTHDITPILFK
jgi:hypothetical protein